jgi:hypothetical protein
MPSLVAVTESKIPGSTLRRSSVVILPTRCIAISAWDAYAVTAVTAAPTIPKNRTLLWAAGVGALWTTLLVASAAACANGLTRADNLAALAISVACVALIGSAALRPSDGLRRVAQLAAGVLGGMFIQPSTGLLLTLVLTGLGLRDAWKSRNRPLGVFLVVVGVGLGMVVTYGVLMRFLAPTDIRC